jgi:hypothetical protein
MIFFVCAPTLDACMDVLNYILRLLRSLGFSIAWEKVVGPAQRITFLGVTIDSLQMLVTLDEKKTTALLTSLREFQSKKTCIKEAAPKFSRKAELGECCGSVGTFAHSLFVQNYSIIAFGQPQVTC